MEEIEGFRKLGRYYNSLIEFFNNEYFKFWKIVLWEDSNLLMIIVEEFVIVSVI